MDSKKVYDVIIVGGGPAGLTAAIYCLRRELKTLLVAKAIGGQAAIAHEIQNWPGIKSIGGFELMQNFQHQAQSLGLEIISNEVVAVEKKIDGFAVKTNSEIYEAEAVILSFGLTPRDLGVPGEEKLKGRGVSYCATCDGPLFKNKTVAVIGGANSALEAAEYLSRLAKKVYLISNTCQASGDAVLVNEVKKMKKVEILCGLKVSEIVGEDKVMAIKMADSDNAQAKELAVDGVFVEIGYMPRSGWLQGTVDLTERGEIKTDKNGKQRAGDLFVARNPGRMHKELVHAIREASGTADTQVGGYLKVLIERFGLIERKLPVFAKPEAKRSRYYVTDNFLRSWLAALGNPVSAIAFRPLNELIDEADHRLADVEGSSLEKLAGQLYEERSRNGIGDFPITHRVRGFWDKAGTEIDLVAFHETTESIRFGSCKRSPTKLMSDVNNFKQHVERFLQTMPKYRGWNKQLVGISPVLDTEQRAFLTRHDILPQDLNDLTRDFAAKQDP